MPMATQLITNRRCSASPQWDPLQQTLCAALIKLRTNWVQEITLAGYGQMTLETGNRKRPVRKSSLEFISVSGIHGKDGCYRGRA